MAQATPESVAEALADLHLGLSEADLVRAPYEGVRRGWIREIESQPAAALPKDQRDFLERHGGIGHEDPSEPERQLARVVLDLTREMASALTTNEVAGRLGLDPARIRHRLRDKALYSLPGRVNRSRVFPDWQFTHDGVIPHLGEVLTAMPEDLHPLEVSGFFHTPQDVLGVGHSALTPRGWLAQGATRRPSYSWRQASTSPADMPKLPKPPPAGDLARHEPEIRTITPDVALWRIHRTRGGHVTAWNELRRFGPIASCRFDPNDPPPHVQDEGVADLALDVPTAVAEAFQTSRQINRGRGAPYLTGFHPERDLELLDLTGGWPLRIGASDALNTGRKDHCRLWAHRLWARALREAWPKVDGLLHSSAMTGRECVTLFDPAGDVFPERPSFSVPLSHPDLDADLAAVAREIGYRSL